MRRFKSGVVVAAHPLAAKAGVEILRRDGNAVDAAVATAQALGSVAPAFSGIGGGGFALIWLDKEERSVFVDYRERAPHAAREDMFLVDESDDVIGHANSQGYLSVATPGTIAGHSLLLDKYGRLGLRETLQPAINYARRGTAVTKTLAAAWKQSSSKIRRFKTSRPILLKKGKSYGVGERFRLEGLAESLAAVAKEGPAEFYTGTIANEICDDMEANRGILARKDFEDFRPTERNPVHGTYKDLEVFSAPPPSCGGIILLQALNMLEEHPLKDYGQNSAQSLRSIGEALTRSSGITREVVCDPDFSTINVHKMISKEYAAKLVSRATGRATSKEQQPLSSTSHLVVIDKERNVVSMTESVECYFGSGIIAGDTGVILNDTMHDFEPRAGRSNSVASWKIPMSSMSPTILLKNGRPVMAVGAAGASRIISSTLQTILNVVGFGMSLQAAVAAPRIHAEGGTLQAEGGVVRRVVADLRKRGVRVETGRRELSWRAGLYFGGVQAACVNSDNALIGAPDPRRDGAAIGVD